MIRATAAELYHERTQPLGVFETPVRQTRRVPCIKQSVGRQEAYTAMANGLRPELIIVLAHEFEYQGETGAVVDGADYRVLRTYVTDRGTIELTLARREDVG